MHLPHLKGTLPEHTSHTCDCHCKTLCAALSTHSVDTTNTHSLTCRDGASRTACHNPGDKQQAQVWSQIVPALSKWLVQPQHLLWHWTVALLKPHMGSTCLHVFVSRPRVQITTGHAAVTSSCTVAQLQCNNHVFTCLASAVHSCLGIQHVRLWASGPSKGTYSFCLCRRDTATKNMLRRS